MKSHADIGARFPGRPGNDVARWGQVRLGRVWLGMVRSGTVG
jgi:hypothetical protein